jgi:hypothetical protein
MRIKILDMLTYKEKIENLYIQNVLGIISVNDADILEQLSEDDATIDIIFDFAFNFVTDEVLDLLQSWISERDEMSSKMLDEVVNGKRPSKYLVYLRKSYASRKRRKKNYISKNKRPVIDKIDWLNLT